VLARLFQGDVEIQTEARLYDEKMSEEHLEGILKEGGGNFGGIPEAGGRSTREVSTRAPIGKMKNQPKGRGSPFGLQQIVGAFPHIPRQTLDWRHGLDDGGREL
jgi:hypothetical protein